MSIVVHVVTIFRFLYFEDHELDESNVISTLYAAEKYEVTELVGICQYFLESKMTEDNVCVIMENARMFNMDQLLTKCKNFIFGVESISRKVFESDGFLDLRKESLSSLIESDELLLDEYFIYESMIRWAKNNCMKEGKCTPHSPEIRQMLGNLIFEVRFAAMSLEKFWTEIASHDILSNEEKVDISKVIVGKTVSRVVFKSTERKRCVQVFRTQFDATSCGWRHGNRVDAIEFEVNKQISLYGILLYGNSNRQYSYDVEIQIFSASNIALVHMLPRKIKESGKVFKIRFDKPCTIHPNQRHTLWVKMNGPDSYRGNYIECVNYNGYEFKFYESNHSNNYTNTSAGQIPGLLCSLK